MLERYGFGATGQGGFACGESYYPAVRSDVRGTGLRAVGRISRLCRVDGMCQTLSREQYAFDGRLPRKY